jgi:hypothetical protein
MSIINTGFVKKMVSKIVTGLIRKRLDCDSAAIRFNEIDTALNNGNVTLQLNVTVTMTEKELMRLIDQKVEEL